MMDMNDEKTSTQLWLLPYRITFALVIAVGVAINYKLYCNVMKENPGERGRVFQQIMKNYTRIQVFGWTFIWIWMTTVLSIMSLNYSFMISPCMVINGFHLGMFSYFVVRFHVGFNSLILAVGRYVFVVHDDKVLNWGVEKVSRVLIISSILIPFLMALLTNSVVTLQYTGWLAPVHDYEEKCVNLTNGVLSHDMIKTQGIDYYRSPFYDFVHLYFPSWVSDGLYLLFLISITALFSNITEGLIYIKCALFVFRSENKASILASLSDDAKLKRRRKTTIGIQITFISWILEFIGICITITRLWIFQSQNIGEWTDRIFGLFDFFMCLIPIPLSYLLNDEAIKIAIYLKGWIAFLRRPTRVQ